MAWWRFGSHSWALAYHTAFHMRQATADKPEAVDDINKMVAGVGMPDPLGYAAQEGFKGTAVKVRAHVLGGL